ncbi:DUF4381 domain-containing protein [Lysobacter pythonis]|uniref:DUF4381 domain-containing protein n=1 Tax=Solilutibacter pythonis TaxID=2483112 RepID=A0A3M2HYG5_9GAMM|nr:DUF4381 family protein [Lysobacter pythonis]RMH93285.1 DUF4381 domain-containing protein [Lysobacter pythonis]
MRVAAPDIVLRDIHRALAPAWWPPAPGWWVVLAVAVAAGAAFVYWRRRRRRRRVAIETLFDRTVTEAGEGPAQVAAISSLLRRAARRHREDADVLEGEAWLALLDEGMPVGSRFDGENARLLLEGGYRRAIDPAHLAALRQTARLRFLRWMGVSP